MGITSGANNPIVASTTGLKDVPEHKQKPMMEAYAKFYGCEDDDAVKKLSYSKL